MHMCRGMCAYTCAATKVEDEDDLALETWTRHSNTHHPKQRNASIGKPVDQQPNGPPTDNTNFASGYEKEKKYTVLESEYASMKHQLSIA